MSDGGALPAHLRRARRDARLTQAALASLLGVRQSTVSQWERGVVSPNSEHLRLLAGRFGADVLDLQRPGRRGRRTDDLAARLRAARRGAGLTQGDVGAMAGVSAGRVSRWELGHVPLRKVEALWLLGQIDQRRGRRRRSGRQAMGT